MSYLLRISRYDWFFSHKGWESPCDVPAIRRGSITSSITDRQRSHWSQTKPSLKLLRIFNYIYIYLTDKFCCLTSYSRLFPVNRYLNSIWEQRMSSNFYFIYMADIFCCFFKTIFENIFSIYLNRRGLTVIYSNYNMLVFIAKTSLGYNLKANILFMSSHILHTVTNA